MECRGNPVTRRITNGLESLMNYRACHSDWTFQTGTEGREGRRKGGVNLGLIGCFNYQTCPTSPRGKVYRIQKLDNPIFRQIICLRSNFHKWNKKELFASQFGFYPKVLPYNYLRRQVLFFQLLEGENPTSQRRLFLLANGVTATDAGNLLLEDRIKEVRRVEIYIRVDNLYIQVY